MKIAVIGTGYVGLVTAAIFSHFGNQVWGIDIDEVKINKLKKGILPFFEPQLNELITDNLKSGRLIFSSSYKEVIPQAGVIFICVGTPPKVNGDYDLSYVFACAKEIGQNLKQYAVVCIKSTVPPSTGKTVKDIIIKETKIPFDIASCPEFLREGLAVKDSFNPSRVVIGTESNKAKEILLKLHYPIKGPRLICDLKSAQLIKYAANAFLATKISFINSIARVCDAIGANIDQVAEGLGLDPRIGREFLNAGLGYGGSCFPKDTWALITFAKRLGYDFKFLKEVDNVNQTQIDYFIEKVIKMCEGTVKNKILTILGLAFKPDTDDMREARSKEVIRKLQLLGAKINAYDPIAMDNAKKILNNINYCDDPYQALKGSEALILITEWAMFKKLDFVKISNLMKKKVIIDARNFYNPQKIKRLGFIYQGIGRK